MLKQILFVFLLIMAKCPDSSADVQSIDTTSFRIYPRLSFYSYEGTGEFLLHIPASALQSTLSVTLTAGEQTLASWKGKPGRNIIRIPFNIGLSPSTYRVSAVITSSAGSGSKYCAGTDLIILKHKPNEVKTDRLTGGLVVNRLPYFPFGFYCYSPVPQALMEEEAVRGFNMISPYQTILPETLKDRKAYMNRCAELGMKVHYNLLSLSGGGGVDSRIKGLSQDEKRKRLREEIRTFMDHPALLSWYISDEPNGSKVLPETLEEIYRMVKETDPWHPVTMVFMAPFMASRKYAGALDIVMADPYPVPNHPIGMVGDVSGQLRTEFSGRKPVWMVLQAFGGGEWWGREPTFQEIRSMTWQSIVNGATGIQYFVRQGPNYFPKSVAAWSECSRMAMEIAELTPWLLSDEEPGKVESSSGNIIVSSRLYHGQLMVMAANKINEPASVSIRIKGFGSGQASVIFENRTVRVSGGLISDHIAPYGSQVYMIDLNPPKKGGNDEMANLLRDPGFEDTSAPGVPSACYARPGGDRGATYFLDTREAHEGNHSLRLLTPAEGKSVALRMFPFTAKAGSTYGISIWAKCDPEQRFSPAVTNEHNERLYNENNNQIVEIELGAFGKARFAPDGEWRRYMTFVTIPADTARTVRTNLIIRMPGQGVAWFDELKIYEEKR
jgi:hypothetical protein